MVYRTPYTEGHPEDTKAQRREHVMKASYVTKVKNEDGGEVEVVRRQLDYKRFLLSGDPEVKKRLVILREAFEALKKKYPEVIALGLLGSYTKGYASKESDFDLSIFIDKEQLLRKIDENDEVKTVYEYAFDIRKFISDYLIRKLSLSEEQTEDIYALFLSESDVKYFFDDKPEKDHLSSLRDISEIFTLTIGTKDIQKYREMVISTLEQRTDGGEVRWREIMKDLYTVERLEGQDFDGSDREFDEEVFERLYPQTLAKAREVFLKPRGEKDEVEI